MTPSRLRSTVLGGLVLALAASSFESLGISSAAYVARYLLAAALILLTASQGRNNAQRLEDMHGSCGLLIRSGWALVIVAATSTIWSISPMETALQTLALVLLVWNMHLHATRRWHQREALSADMRTIFWVLAATVVISLALGGVVGTRLSGVYENPNSLGIVAMFTAGLGIGLALETRKRLLTVAASGFAVVAVAATNSRTALLGTILAAALLLIRRRWSPAIVIGLCFSAALIVFAYLLNGSIPLPSTVARFRSHGSAGILSDRQLAWDFGIRLWELRPWTGYGFRTGELLFVENRGIAHGSTIGAALNSYLQILIELGYIGIFPLAGMILALIWGLAHLRFLGMRAGLAALVVSGLASGVTESALFGLGSVICWVFWFAATALTVTAHKNSKITSPPPLRQVPRNTGAFQ